MIEVHGIRGLLLDIEGTTSSLSFVKDTLFPYARSRLPDYVRAHEGELAEIFTEVRAVAGAALSVPEIIQQLLAWMDEDRKVTPLKTLQGLIWKAGYVQGGLRGHLYKDAFEALKAWHAAGLKLCIYSSGSVAAQQLLFAHTPYGDLTPLLSAYFDTRIGSKLEPASYAAIARAVDSPPGALLFLSDHPGEVQAARGSGLRAIRVDREAPRSTAGEEPVLHCFRELAINQP